MEEQDNISILYGKMQDKGLVKSGSEDDFRAYLNEGDNWQSVYDKISSPDVNLVKSGSADDFHAWLGLSGGQQEEPKPKATTSQPQATPQANTQAAQQPNEYAKKMAYNPYGDIAKPYISYEAAPIDNIPEEYRDAYAKLSPVEQRVFSRSLEGSQQWEQQMSSPEGRSKAAQNMRDVAGNMRRRDPRRKQLLERADALDHSEDALRTPEEMRALAKTEEDNEAKEKTTTSADGMLVQDNPEYYHTKKEAQRIKDEQYRAIEGRAVAMGKHTDNYTKGSDIYRDATDIFDQTDEGKVYNAKLENSIQLDRDDFAMSMLNSDNEELKEVAQMYSQFGDIEREGQQLAALNESLKQRAETLDTTNEDAVNAYNKDVEAAQKRYDAYLKQIEEYDKLRKSGAFDKYNEAFQEYITENDESATKGVLQEKNDAMTAMFGDWIDRKSIHLQKKIGKDFTDELMNRINDRRSDVEVPNYLLNNPMHSPLGISGKKTESGALTTASQYAKKAYDLISNEDGSFYSKNLSLVKGFVDDAASMDFLTFGLTEAARGFIDIGIMKKVEAGKDQLSEDERRAYDSAVEKGYKNLTPEEEAATEKAAQLGRENLNEDEKLAYDAMQNYWQVQQLFKPSGWYTAGQVTADALPFIVAMWGSGGIVNAIKGGAKGAEKVALRQVAKQAEKQATKLTFKQAAKNVGKVAGNISKAAGNMALEGAVYASTTGLPHTVAGTLEYLMPKSNATYDLEEGGIKVNRLEESEDSVLSAAAKSWGTQMIEGMSEAFSTYALEPLEAAAYARLFGKTAEELAKGGNRAYKDIVRAAFKKGSMGDGIFRNVSSFPNEYIEELFGGFARCVVGLSEWDQEFSGETLAQTAYGLLPMQVVFSAMGGGNLRKHRQRMRQAETFLNEFSPDSKALYDRLSGMSTYEGQDLLDREILSIQQEVDALKQADKFTPEMQQKMAARMNMALVMKEQLYMDEAAATIKEEQQRNAYENATSNLNEQNGNLVYAEYKDEDGNNKRGWIISQDGENTVISDGKKRFKVKSSDVTELEEYTMEEVEDHIIGEGGQFAIEAAEDIANPVAGQDYYDHRDDTPLVLEGGGMLHVDEVDDDGNVTFTLNGRQATVSRRQFREIVQQSRNNMEYAEADTQAFNEIGKGMQSVAVRSEDPMLNAQLGRRGRDARAYLAEAVGEERVRQMEQMDGKDLARAYAEADATTKTLMQNWMELGGYDMGRTYEEAINERVDEAANQQYKRFEEFALRQDEQTANLFSERGDVTTATLDGGERVIVGTNDGNEAVVMDMAGNMQMVSPTRLTDMHNSFAMNLARQTTQGVAQQMQALQTAYNGTAFQADTEHTIAVSDEGVEDKAVIVGFGNNGSVAYATEYSPNKEGGYNIANRSVKEVSADEFRDMVEGAQRKAAMQQARKAEESKAVADQGIVKDGQDVTVMVGNKPAVGKYVLNAGHHFVVDAEGKVIGDFKSMDELKASMQEAQAAATAGEQMAREAELVEQSEMEKEYQRRLDEAKTTEERAQVIQEYLDQIKTEDFTMLTDKNYEAAMRKAGATEEDIADFRRNLAITRLTGQRVRGFNLVKGGIFIHADDIVSIEDARTTYVHERQHTITRNNVPLQKQILNSATEEELKRYVSILSGGSTFYNDKKVGVVAEEFISMAMEVAYKTADVEAALRGMGIDNEALIQTIKQLDNEQRTEGHLSDSRRGSLGNEPQRSDNRNDVSDTEREPGQVGEPRPRPAGRGGEETGGSQEVKSPAQLLDELIGREGDNAANKLANTISAIQGSIATAEANLAEARQRRDNLPEPYNEETQAAMDAANAEITNLINEIDNLNKQAATYMLMQREQEKRFNEWMNSMSENEDANYSITEADAERLDTEINLASEGTTEDGQQIRYSVSAIFQGIGLECFDKEGNPMTDKDGNVIARIGDKVYDGHHFITAEEVAALRGTWNTITKMALDAGYVKQDAVDMLNQKYADIINSFLVTGLDENGGTENLIDRWMWLGETVFRTIAKNGDKQYSFSADITRLCKKNEQIIKSISAMQSRVGYGITPSQIIDIYTKTFDKGYQVPCPVCYVFNRYIRNGKYATAAIKGMERYGQHLPGGSEPWTAKQWKRELDRLTRKNETNKSNAKAIARAQKALDNIPDEVDKLGNMLMNDKTGRIKLTEQERNEINRRIEKLNEMYQAAMDLYANAAMSNWIKSFAIRSVNGKWVLYDDAKLPTDMADFRDCSLDLRKTAVTIGKYPGVQRLRKSGGAAAGKEVTFASNNEIGEFLSGIGAGSPETAPNVFAEAVNGDKKALKKALDRLKNAYVYAQRQSLRGGQRMWSWSDNLENLMPDVAMNLMQLQLVGGALQSYSKQLEGINLVARMGGYVNGSLMAKDNGYRELTEDDIVMVDGKPTLKERIHETIMERVIEDGVVKDVPRDRTLAEAGAPVIEIGGKYYTAIFDDVIGVDFYGRDGKKGLKQLNETLDKAGNIIVGMNDTHIRVCLADPRIFFCIPWHSSGASNHILQQMLNILGTDIENFVSTDYTKMQEEKNYADPNKKGEVPDVPKEVLALWEKAEAIAKENKWKSGIGTIPNSKNGKVSAKQLEYRALRAAIFDGSIWNNEELLKKAKADEFLKQVMRKMQERGLTEMTNADNEFIYPYEYWDETSTYDNADINGRRYLEYCRRLGVKPKFSGKLDNGRWTDEGNFVDDPGYWKLLIDRRMYGVDGKFQDLTPIDASGFSTELVDPNHNRSEFYVTQVAEDESISDIVDEVVEEENERMGEQHAVNYEMPFDDALAGFYNSFGITPKDIEEDAEVEEEEEEEEEGGDTLQYSIRGEIGAANDAAAVANLDVAKDMEAKGKDAKTIWMATGWERGADGKWRNEIPDAEQKQFNPFNTRLTLDKVIDTPELFSSYPELRKIKVRFKEMPTGVGGYYDSRNNVIVMPNYSINYRGGYGVIDKFNFRTILHEIQHVIQNIEGFARGGNIIVDLKSINGIDQDMAEFAELFGGKTDAGAIISFGRTNMSNELETRGDMDGVAKRIEEMSDDEYRDFVNEAMSIYDKAYDEARKEYRRVAGEVEARNVETRFGMTEEDRRSTPLSETEDVNREDQIVRYSVTAQQDADYMDAVSRGDMETAQRMVDKAANAAFPNSKLIKDGSFRKMWHFTNSDFTSFLPGVSNDPNGVKGIYFAPTDKGNLSSRLGEGRPYYLNATNPVVPAAREHKMYAERLREMQKGVEDRAEIEEINRRFVEETGVDAFVDWMNGWYTILTPEQIKSADPVTYDDQGNVIPLSERFNEGNDDIRYSIVNEQGELNYEELDNIIRGQRNELAGLSRIPEEAVGRAVATPAIAAEAIARGVRQANLAKVWGEDRSREHTRELIKQWAKQSGHWYDEARLTEDATEGRGGTESRVFVTNNGETVRKLTSPVFSQGNAEPYIESLHLFGNVFGESAYDIKGFGENDKGELCVVVEQPYIQGVRLSDSGITKSLDKIREFMESLGFKEYGVSMFENDKYRVEDVNRTNVIVDANGNFHVIDAYVSLADESLYKEEPMYSFIGRSGAQRLDLKERAMTRTNSLYDARRLEEMLGNTDDATRKIKLATGWERGKDGKWRYEISDEDYAYYPEGLKRFYQENPLDQEMISLVKKNRSERSDEDNERLDNYIKQRGQQIEDYKASQGEITLDDVIDHEELFRAYPQLRGVKVVFTNMEGGKRGQYDSGKNEISISSAMPTGKQRSTLIHEIQHAIQDIEGFAQGGNPSYVAQAVKDMDNNAKIWGYKLSLDEAAAEHPEHADNPDALLNDILEGMTEEEAIKKGWIPEENLRKQAYKIYEGRIKGDSYEKAYKQWYDKLREAGRTNYFEGSPFDLYKRLAGEVEARNTQARLGMTYRERLESLAKDTEDVAREDQLIMMAGDPILYSVTANEDTDMGRPTMKEITTEYLWTLAEQQQNDWLARADAVTAFNQLLAETMLEMRNMGKADKLSKKTQGQISRATEGSARAQERFDKAKAEKVMRMAQMMMRYGNMDSLTRGEVNRLMSAMKNAIEPQGMFEQAQKVIDIMVQHQLRDAAKVFGKQLRTKTSRVENGVEKQAGLDLQGQRIIKTLREALTYDDATFADKMDKALAEMYDKKDAALVYEGLLLAKQYRDDIDNSKKEEKKVKADLREMQERIYDFGKDGSKKLKPEYKGKLDEEHKATKKEVQGFEEAAEDKIRELRMERIDAYARLSKQLGDVISGSRDQARDRAAQELERVLEILHNANSDLLGIPDNEQEVAWRDYTFGEKADSAVQFLTAPSRNFNEFLRFFGDKSPDGRGYLWNRFIRQATEARDNEWRNLNNELARLNQKASEILGGKVKMWSDITAIERKMPNIKVTFKDGSETFEHTLTQGNALYIYMVNKMSDGAMKLRAMGISEEDVERITEQLDPRFIELADWIQEDFLPSTRERYNEVHERMFGAPMASIENYFKLRINARSRGEEKEIGKDNETQLPSTVTGSIIKRTHNVTALAITTTDAFNVVMDTLAEMEHWAAYAELSRDLSTLLSYKRFRNRVANMSSARLGVREDLLKNFEEVCNIVCGTYKPKRDKEDKFVRNITKGVTASKINFRVYTALKQITSIPAFWTRASIGDIVKNGFNPTTAYTSWKWAMEELPGFSRRWQSRQSGYEMLDPSESDWALWRSNFVQTATRLGMSPNAFVDALTVCTGAKSVYDTSLRRYKEAGYSEEEAKKKALLDASTAYNETQQSNDPAYLSIMQAHRTFLNSMLSLFRNSSFSYGRLGLRAAHNIKKMMKKGYKDSTIEFLTKQGVRDGLTEQQAKESAERVYNRQWRRNFADLFMYNYLIEFVWNLAPYAVYLIGGNDKKKKREMLTDAARHSAFGIIEGMPGGNLASTFLSDVLAKRDWSSYSYHLLPMISEVEKIKKEFSTDPVAAANDIVGIIISSFSGVDPRGLSDIVVAIMDACNGDPELSIGAALLIMRIAEVPQSQLDELMIDEIGMTAGEARKLPADQVAKRYANYKLHRNAPLTSWAYDDEAKQKKLTKYENVLLKKAEDRLNSMSDEDAATYFDETDDITIKSKMAKKVFEEYGYDKDEDGGKPTKKDSEATAKKKITYQKMRTLEDVKEDAAVRAYFRDNEASDDAKTDKRGLDKVKAALGDEDESNDKDAMELYRTMRKALIDTYNIEVK